MDTSMPVLFLGHGSPMNAIEENVFVHGFRKMAEILPRPSAILCVSAHWETRGTQVTAMEQPRTIHDFGGFPKELYDVQYPAPGKPSLASEVQRSVKSGEVDADLNWGLDHGAWSVLKHLYPKADVPVVQLSLDRAKAPAQHLELAKELKQLRKKGVLLVGSGNLVHNLRLVAWDKLSGQSFGYDWALEVSEKLRTAIITRDWDILLNFRSKGTAFELAIPTPEHFLPLLYTMAWAEDTETVNVFNDAPVGGSLTMTSIQIG